MTAAELFTTNVPALQLTNTVGEALQQMLAHNLEEIPVLNDKQLVGLLREEELQEADPADLLQKFTEVLDASFVHPTDFFLVPLKIMHQRKLSLLPVVKENKEYMGVVTDAEILRAAAHYNAASEPGGVLILQMLPNNFSISEIGRIVESNNAKIIHLNTWTDTTNGQLMVAIKVNKNDIQDILASFERYEYHIVQYFGENLSEEELKLNFDHLMNYLNI